MSKEYSNDFSQFAAGIDPSKTMTVSTNNLEKLESGQKEWLDDEKKRANKLAVLGAMASSGSLIQSPMHFEILSQQTED